MDLQVADHDYDMVVIGAGINGAGVAQAAAAAGFRVLVLEKTAPAAGTSSKSSKLIHGGLRYLESLEFGLVRESLHERALLLKLAPEIVRLQEFCIPVYQQTRRGPLLLRAGLTLYWALTGFDRNGRFGKIGSDDWERLHGLRTDGLRTVFRYYDAATDDAMLTRAVLHSAGSLGAELEYPAYFNGADLTDNGCIVNFNAAGREQSRSARVLVNAAGPWVGQVAAGIRGGPPALPVALVQGTHIEVEGQLGSRFFYLESPRDGRAVFVMPREGRIIVGTTETRFSASPDSVHPLHSEESYLLAVLAHYFPQFGDAHPPQLLTSWAGLRVLPGGSGHAFHKSRETILQTDREDRPRCLSVYGGKLTTYRTTALKVMEKLGQSLPDRRPKATTDRLSLQPVD